MKIKITGISEANLYASNATKIIGLIDPKTNKIETDRPYHVERFHDIDHLHQHFQAPNYSNIENVLNFSKDFTKEDDILIHCHAGVSRSTAIALLVLIQHGSTIEKAFEYVYDIRDCMNPNPRIIEMGDDILNLNGELAEYFYGVWKKEYGVEYGKFAGQGNTKEMKQILRMIGS